MRFKIERELVDNLDDEVLVQDLGIPIGDLTRAPTSKAWTVYSANAHLHRALVSVASISDAVVEVLNGGVSQLVENPAGGLIPDLPMAYRHLNREREAEIFEAIIALFPDEETIRDYEKRNAFASTDATLADRLDAWNEELAGLMQSDEFFASVADFIRKESDAFEIVE